MDSGRVTLPEENPDMPKDSSELITHSPGPIDNHPNENSVRTKEQDGDISSGDREFTLEGIDPNINLSGQPEYHVPALIESPASASVQYIPTFCNGDGEWSICGLETSAFVGCCNDTTPCKNDCPSDKL